VELVRLESVEGLSHARAAGAVGYSRSWARKWMGRYRHGGLPALQPHPAKMSHPLSRFAPAVAEVARAYRQSHPLIGARRAVLELARDPRLAGVPLPDARTLHRFFAQEGLVPRSLPKDRAPAPPVPPDRSDPHAVWQIDHQDHLAIRGVAGYSVLQSIRVPAIGLSVGADLFDGPQGAHAVPEDEICDGLRRSLLRFGRPLALSVDQGVRFLGQPQRQFPSRFELFCRGLQIRLCPIRPAHPTDHGAVERLHRTFDGVLLGPTYTDRAAAQQALDQHLDDLNERFPSRAKHCHGKPPLVAFPKARHSGRPYDPTQEWATFDLAAVDRFLADWRWFRLVGKKTGQISFDHHNLSVGRDHRGELVALSFDPRDRQVVVCTLGPTPDEPGPEIMRFHCPAFDKEAILGTSRVSPRPTDLSPDPPVCHTRPNQQATAL